MGDVYRYGFADAYRLDPMDLYAKLRPDDPVARVTTPYGDDAWLVTRHESVKAVLHDPRLSRAAAVAAGDRRPRSGVHLPTGNIVSEADPPEHSRLRQLIAGALTKHKTQQHRPRAEQIANELIDKMIAAGPPGDVDHDFARPFPIFSLGGIMGIPKAEVIQAKDWSEPILSRRGYTAEQIAAAHTRLRDYITGLLANRREHPQDDFLTGLAQAAQNGKNRYTDQELAILAAILLINDSTPRQIANCLYVLLTHPDQLAWLRAHPDRIPQAVEELLRFTPLAPDIPSGGQGNVRYAVDDIEIDGVMIQAGEWVLPSIISANRDERVFTDPDRLDLTRTRNPHIAFGFGTHHCPGAALARMQLQVALATVLTRLPEVELAVPVDEVQWMAGNMNRGPEGLPVTW